jgi:nucleotide-binding universal stress UspA family protein
MTKAPEKAAVVVGVKQTQNSRAVLRLAAREARYRDAALIAVMAYGSNPALGAPAGRPIAAPHTADDERLAAESALRVAVTDALGEQAGQVEQLVMPGLDGRSLVEVAHKVNAGLLVLAGGGTASVLPGSVSQYVLRKAPCPVLIVPDADQVGAPS